MSEERNSRISRREFLRRAAAGAAFSVGATSAGIPHVFAAPAANAGGMKYHTLGRTGLKVSELSMGGGRVPVVHRALDLGVNYLDTAPSYGEGAHETMLGEALQGRRSKAIIATKWHGGTADELVAQVEKSLSRLQTDHVDIVQIHGASGESEINSEERWKAFNQLKEAGKVRFNGLTYHPESVGVVSAAIKSGRYDMMLTFYSVLSALQTGPAIHEAAKAGMGVVVMKALQPAHEGKANEALMNLRGNAYQKAIQWVLTDRSVSTVNVGMDSFDQLEENVAAVISPMTLAEKGEFERAVAQMATGTCHLCGACNGNCPMGVKIADAMRCLLYYDGHRDFEKARATYRMLPVNAATCAGCGECTVSCPWQVPVRPRLERAHALLA